MFPSFTGSSRPRRQVNLSGRSSNPFAAVSAQNTQNALAQAQRERLWRQQERERPPAAQRIQKTWRGHRSRQETRKSWRAEWDWKEAHARANKWIEGADEGTTNANKVARPYDSQEECLMQLRLLVQFASAQGDDIQRLHIFVPRFIRSLHSLQIRCSEDSWKWPLLRLARLSAATLQQYRRCPLGQEYKTEFMSLLSILATAIPQQITLYSQFFFQALAETAISLNNQNPLHCLLLEKTILGLLQHISAVTVSAYQGFASEFLTIPNLPTFIGSLDPIAHGLNYKMLACALTGLLEKNLLELKSREELIWLLAYFIFFRRSAHGLAKLTEAPDPEYVKAVSRLISYLAEDIGLRIEIQGDSPPVDHHVSESSQRLDQPLPGFVRDQILNLVNQQSVTSLLAHSEISPTSIDEGPKSSSQASALASYALTLLRVFPRRGDEIRMWLYLGSASRQSIEGDYLKNRLPAIKYFWQAVNNTKAYALISKDPREAIDLLAPDAAKKSSQRPASHASQLTREARDQEWRIILLFLELYTFVLKVMDDEEFLSGASLPNVQQSWTRQSALSLEGVKDLTKFLKNLAFSMYWNASAMTGIEEAETMSSIAEYFSNISGSVPETRKDAMSSKIEEVTIAGVNGMTLNYMKGMVTGLLRMIYERDSRRKFLPNDHWLMTRWFDMEGFTSAVVAEEEHRHQIQEANDADGDGLEADIDEVEVISDHLIGTQRTQQVRNIERLKRQQRKASRRKYLESITPRLEILQNMPFFIPFATRVQIFREFVMLDQIRRRGVVDADEWRFSVMNNASGRDTISRHRAKVRRESIFDDALAQFYDLGEGLKEPIQITFVDKFDTVEAGIDGGGVTKEFLTSITSEAFNPKTGPDLFVENDQHLLYPNPSAIDERKDILRQAGFKEGSADWNEPMRDLLRRYEFLGRVIGKCLYEGILVDIHFAGFFLLKWALTGGSGSATKESSYRANINDLRDLDEGLYQGLLQLKNYPGNVEDFCLNFAVTDVISAHTKDDQPAKRTITRELRPNGSEIAVTNENRLVYISYIARHRLQVQPHLQTSAFLRGLGDIISPSWLSMFNQSELQTLVGGDSSEIDISDLRRNTLYGGVYVIGNDLEEHPSVKIFWKVMQALSDEDRRKVLKFVTSTPRAPLLGFDQLNPRFSIRDSGNDQTRLPSTSTCVNLLKLPIYATAEILRDRLLYAVNAGAGFNLS